VLVMQSQENPRFSDAFVARLKERYDPKLVDTLLTRIDGIDLEVAYKAALDAVTRRTRKPAGFEAVALERRKHEAAIIKEEVVIFREMGRLMASINERYRALTGLGPKLEGE
jgi:hypothetical protein